MKIKVLSFIFVLLFSTNITRVLGQNEEDPNRAYPVIITNSGDLLSTYNLENDSAMMKILREKYSEDNLNAILKGSTESGWPDAISTLDGRNKVREQFKQLNAYELILVNNVGLLYIPASENQHISPRIVEDYDIFLLIGKNGYTHNETTYQPTARPTSSATTTITSSGDFAKDLNVIVADFEYNFRNIIGEKKPSNDKLLEFYKSKINIAGAQESEVLKVLLGSPTFIARFGTYATYEEAEKKYIELFVKMKAVKFPQVRWVINDEYKSESTTSTAFLPFNAFIQTKEIFNKVMMEATIQRNLTLKSGDLKYEYAVTLRVEHTP